MNLFKIPVSQSDDEQIEVLFEDSSVRVERIISMGQISPAGFWYQQEEDERVAILQGEAILRVQDSFVHLLQGDTYFLPALLKHRVEFTSKDPACIWLCLFTKKRET